MIIIGVAGGIASGKSTVCRIFESLGATIIDADRVGHEVLEMPAVKASLCAAFGRQIVDADNRIDRKILGGLVFSDAAAKSRLDGLVHPPLVAEIHRRIEELRQAGDVNVVIVDAALLIEWDEVEMVDSLVIVTAPVDNRVMWLTKRNGLSVKQAEQRMDAQLGDAKRSTYADHVIENDSDPVHLRQQALKIWDLIVTPK